MPNASIIYVGTEDGLAIYQAQEGAGWQRVGHALAGAAIRAVVTVTAQILLVNVEGQPAQQSFDGGATWSAADGPAPEPIGLQVATVRGPAPLNNPRLMGATAYARLRGRPGVLLGAGAGGTQIFRSEDDGIHWQPTGIAGAAIGRVSALIPAADRAESAWAGTDTGALLRSDDRGHTWGAVAREGVGIVCLAAVGS